MNKIYATWMISNNIGDTLTPWLIEKMTGEKPIYIPFNYDYPKYMVCGSVLNHATKYTTVWGAGYANSQDTTDPKTNVLAVRGKLTSERLSYQASIRCNVYGDPAILMPRYYNPKIEKKYKVGICPHFANQLEFHHWMPKDNDTDFKFLNVFDKPETFVDNMLACDVVYSSSLHGLIIAHAYGVPAEWVEGSMPIGGDSFKFIDYFATIGIDDPENNHISQLTRDAELLKSRIINNLPPSDIINKMADDIMKVCPFVEKGTKK